jgi:formate dehydrogenase subunit gamma
VEQVFCFGNCALGPAVEVNGRLAGRVDANRLDALLADANPSDRAVKG